MANRLPVLGAPALVCLGLAACSPSIPAERVLYEGPGVTVPSDFGCWHDTGYVVNWPKNSGQDLYHGPDPAFKVRANRVRLYGMGGLEWNATEKSPGVFDWARWDEAIAKLRSTDVKHLTLNPYNPPAFATRRAHDYSKWGMQLPRERDMLERWLTAVTRRYPEVDAIEVANEVFAPRIGPGQSFFIGPVEELTTLADWVLDWRQRTGWKGQVWAPSIPGFGDNIPAMLKWLRGYPRAKEFDAFPLHLYHLMPEHVGKRMSKDTVYSALVEFREGLAELGLGPMIDSEKGFQPGTVREGTLYNYAVAALLQGVRLTCYFFLGSYGNDETNLGQPFRNAWAKQDLEALADLAGKTITRVFTTREGRWQVTTIQSAPGAVLPAASSPRPSMPAVSSRP
jgi:hypothetical protein